MCFLKKKPEESCVKKQKNMPAFKKLKANKSDSQEVKIPAGSQRITRQRGQQDRAWGSLRKGGKEYAVKQRRR